MKKYNVLFNITIFILVLFGINGNFETIQHHGVDTNNTLAQRISSEILENADYVEDAIIVTLDSSISGFDQDHSKTIFKNFDSSMVHELTKITNYSAQQSINQNTYKQIYQIQLNSVEQENLLEIIEMVASYDGVYHVEPVYKLSHSLAPNDPHYKNNDMWGLNGTHGIKAPNAWNISTGSSSIRVGVIDTGISNHDDLVSNLVEGWDVLSDTTITSDDDNGHGTHVAGTIGAVGNNNLGVVGVNWDVSLVPIQANNGSSNSFTTANLIKAINYATNLWGSEAQIDILNYSISGYGSNVSVREAVRNFPGLFVWAAGNDEADIDTMVNNNGTFNLPNVISVGSMDSNGNRLSSSNFSTNNVNVNIYAPGGNILSTVPRWRTWPWQSWNYYKSLSGTSMAAPHVTGVAALLLSVKPDLSASEIKNIIIDSADSVTISIPNGRGGTTSQVVKKLNAYSALQSASHTHSYTHTWLNYRQHASSCTCGENHIRGHVISSGWTGIGYATCLVCGGPAEIGFVEMSLPIKGNSISSIFIEEHFGNGSYVLSNGVIVLSDEDLENFYNGTLIMPDCDDCDYHIH